eukprot:TRINITY_DN17577_c0_g1_i1.p1 TRINITY_DN17577_c0_g1~~TRINITY_DN17577_c0_g1_i1.p1  ORF type:complete len:395 (-),score=107.86 TRINITY_DN17577_c0_g1_i1:64-1248(-)
MYGAPSESSAAIYGITNKARCIAAQTKTDNSRFFVGTLAINAENEVHLIEVNDQASLGDGHESPIRKVAVYPHKGGEIWHLAASPVEPSLLATGYQCVTPADSSWRATVWRVPPEYGQSMSEVAELKGAEGPIKGLVWHPKEDNAIMLLDSEHIRQVVLDSAGTPTITNNIAVSPLTITSGQWHPLLTYLVAVTTETGFRTYDLRSSKKAFGFKSAHQDAIRCLDFNPSNAYCFATGGDDCKVKIWDSRKTVQCVKELAGHSHWVWNVKYNPCHDELLISSGSDCKVILWNIVSLSHRVASKASVSTAPQAAASAAAAASAGIDSALHTPEDDAVNRPLPPDGIVKTYDDHEDSVYGLAWGASSSSSWNFASLSYVGRVVVNYVPQEYADAYML